MRNITIYHQDIIPNAKYMCDAEGRCDLLGQILTTGYAMRIPPKTRTPQCLQTSINNFVVCIRQYVYSNTPLTQKLLSNSNLSPRKQIEEANRLLNPVGINLVVADDQEAKQEQAKQAIDNNSSSNNRSSSLTFTNLLRTSIYHCSCGQNCCVTSLVQDEDSNGKLYFYCPYCSVDLDDDLTNQVQNQFPQL